MKNRRGKLKKIISQVGFGAMLLGVVMFTSCTVNFDDITTGDIEASGNDIDAESEISDNEISADGNTISDNTATFEDLFASAEIGTDGDDDAEVEITAEEESSDSSETSESSDSFETSESSDSSETSESSDSSETSESSDSSETSESSDSSEEDVEEEAVEEESATTITFDFTFTDQTSTALAEATQIHISEVQGRGTAPVDLESGKTDASSQWNDVILTIADITDAWDAGYNIHIAAEYRDTVDPTRRIHFISLSEALEAAGLITDASDLGEAADYLNDNAGTEIVIDVSFPN